MIRNRFDYPAISVIILKRPEVAIFAEEEYMDEREYASRRRRYRDFMAREKVDGLLLTNLADIRYLCGFTGSSGVILLLPGRGYLLTDPRYDQQSREEVTGCKAIIFESGLGEALARLIGKHSGSRLGFDADSLSYAQTLALRRDLKGIAHLAPLKDSPGLLRASKSRREVDIIEKAVHMAQAAFQEVLCGSEGAIKENELAMALDAAARRMGADGQSFETIVAGGPRGAMAHARPTARRLKGMVVVDWGIVWRGYHTDMTRTLAFGRAPSSLRRAHALVLEAQRRAMEKVKPGARARDVDRAAREVIEAAGYGDAFGHGLGHGVGLEVHERPWVSKASRDVLEEGMVFTLEPGIYIPGEGGVRVEDMVVVTRGGAALITTLPRALDTVEYCA
jgi:Xaa-Pro aminopeptidase